MFLEREIKSRKQTFGVEIYDLMDELEAAENISTEDKEAKIRAAFDQARKDIAVIQAKKDCKKEEMSVLDTDGTPTNDIPPSSGTVLTNTHPQDSEVNEHSISPCPPLLCLFCLSLFCRRRTCNFLRVS